MQSGSLFLCFGSVAIRKLPLPHLIKVCADLIRRRFLSGQLEGALEGLLGISEGSKSVTLELTLAVPIGGEEFPFDDRWDTGAITSVQVGQGTKAFIANGKIMDVRTEQSTGEPAKQTVTWRGEPKANQ